MFLSGASAKPPRPTPTPQTMEDRLSRPDFNKKVSFDGRKVEGAKSFEAKAFENSKTFATKEFDTRSFTTKTAETKRATQFEDKKAPVKTAEFKNRQYDAKASPDSQKAPFAAPASSDAKKSNSYNSKEFQTRQAGLEGTNQKNLDKKEPLTTDEVKQILNKK